MPLKNSRQRARVAVHYYSVAARQRWFLRHRRVDHGADCLKCSSEIGAQTLHRRERGQCSAHIRAGIFLVAAPRISPVCCSKRSEWAVTKTEFIVLQKAA